MKKLCLLTLFSFIFIGVSTAQTLRAPAYPLVSVDPYFSIWSFNDKLNEGPTVHWTGKENSLQGIIRVDGQSYYFLGQPIQEYKTVLPLSDGNNDEWTYTTTKPGEDWYTADFSTEGWTTEKGAFTGDLSESGNSVSKDEESDNWTTSDIWLRRKFTIKDTADLKQTLLKIQRDDNAEVYLNGELASETEGAISDPELEELSDDALRTLNKGKNIIAIHAENTGGEAYIDAGLTKKIKQEASFSKAKQQSVKISATQTFYQFEASGITLNLTFTAPLIPDNLDLVSRPVNYVSFEVKSSDQETHDVQLYFSSAGNLAVNSTDQKVNWNRSQTENLDLMRVGTESQDILGRKGDDVRIDWGYHYLGVPRDSGATSLISSSTSSVKDFVDNGSFSGDDDKDKPRPAEEDPVTLATTFELGDVSSSSKSRHIVLGYDDIYSVEYFHQNLKSWWRKDGMTTLEMLSQAEKDYDAVLQKSSDFDEKLRKEAVEAGGEKYAKISELAFRQSIAAHKLVEGPKGNPLFLSKENFSNGSIGTVDITYPSSPLYLMYNPELLKGMMIPILYYSESGKYDHPFAAHDVGTYPIANGMTYGEPMPIEETGNMLILAAAISKAEGEASFAENHWEIFTKWAEYLKEEGLDPENQLSTDDFSGHLAHNANLSVKAILALASYGDLADQIGEEKTGETYTKLARDYAEQWMEMAEEEDHYKLTFDKEGTWSQKYNLIWDKLLGLNIFPEEVAKKELDYYLTKQNKYGLPLDSRETYTKADWILWTATLADNRDTFNSLVDPVFKYLDETPSRVPFSDWYETTDAKQVGFQARSVVGAFFMKLLDETWNH